MRKSGPNNTGNLIAVFGAMLSSLGGSGGKYQRKAQKMKPMVFSLFLIVILGCDGVSCVQQPIPQHDCVKDDFNYDFYEHSDQARIVYCYAELQAIARQHLQEHPER